MAAQFYPLAIKEISKETKDCVSLVFNVLEEQKQHFLFTAGQHITLKLNIEGKEYRRNYSICAAPYEDELKIAVKKVDEGIVSTYLNNNAKQGDCIDVLPPTGKFFTSWSNNENNNYIAIAAGSGITPILSIIKQALYKTNAHFTLVYGNKNIGSIIFKEALEALKNLFPNRFHLIHILSKQKSDAPINNGRINETKLQELSKVLNWQQFHQVFICGPEPMLFCVRDFLVQVGLPKSAIHFELFGTNKSNLPKTTITETGGAKTKVVLKNNGRFLEFDMLQNENLSVLDAALSNGADLPYACKGGVCCTCKAKLKEGKVHMPVHWGLEDFEIEQGYILTCQSQPLTEKVVVDYDDL